MAFAVWLTGLPASGKSSIARALAGRLAARGVAVETLESDEIRRILTPEPRYSEEERDLFYRALAWCGTRLCARGTNVLFDATAHRRAWRDAARAGIAEFAEVHVDCPLDVCRARDRKGTYRAGERGASSTVPGLQSPYEAPRRADLVLDAAALSPGEGAARIVDLLEARGWLSPWDADAP